MQLEIQLDLVLGHPSELNELTDDLVEGLGEVVTRTEGEYGVEGGDETSAGGEEEEVGVSVLGDTTGCGFGELFLVEGRVGVAPGGE